MKFIPTLIGLTCTAGLVLGCLMFVEGDFFNHEKSPTLLHRLLGMVCIALGFLVPCSLVFCCAWWKTPPRQSFYHDSLLDQLLSGTACVFAV